MTRPDDYRRESRARWGAQADGWHARRDTLLQELSVPRIDGVVLTFIETGARAEMQHSRRLATPQAKLAAVTNAVISLYS